MPRPSRARPASASARARKSERAPTASRQPAFRKLRRPEILEILRRNHVGRVAYTLHDQVEVVPVHYVFDGSWLYVRTSPGYKATVLGRNRWIAFEVDEIEAMFTWRSVLVRGTTYLLSPNATPDLARRYERAVKRLRGLLPATLTPHDPVPFRTLVLGIHIESATGREAVG